jgi:hypothetical protein
MLNRELLVEDATGQEQRNMSDVSIRGHLSKMHVLTRKLNEIEDLRFDALYFYDDGNGDGRVHGIPFGFKWPSYNTSTVWNLWHFGDANRGIGPYKAISREHDLTSTLCKTNCTRTKVVMKALIAFAVGDRIIASAFDINQDNNQAIFDHAMPLLMEEIYPDPHERPMDLNINTLSNRMQRNNRNHL